MKKILLKYYFINLFIGVILFFIYRFCFVTNMVVAENWLDFISVITLVFLNFNFSMIFFGGIMLTSLTFFLNMYMKVRNNQLWSFLSFMGLPLLCVLILVISMFPDYGIIPHNPLDDRSNPMGNLIMLSLVYLIIVFIEFLFFRRFLKKHPPYLLAE